MNKEEQIQLLFSKGNYEIARDFLNGDRDALDSFFTISIEDFYEYVDKLKLPYGNIFDTESLQDGIYVLKKGEKWQLVIQERGQHLQTWKYDSYLKAKRAAFELEYRRGIKLKGMT